MRVTRVYCDETGESHFDEKEIELRDYDWHVAPQRQFIVLLDGTIEIEVSDGSRRVLCGGEILLMEDTSGKGHRTRNVEASERRSLFIALENTPSGP